MIISYIALLLIISIKSRVYDSLEKIYKNIIQNIHQLSLNFTINGTNDYSYHFKSEDILFRFNLIYLSDPKKEIIFKNQHIKILFNLKIYDYYSGLFDISSKELIYSENFSVDIAFKYLKFYKEFDDFSFNCQYEIENIENDILLNFENIHKLYIYKYLFFEEKQDKYGNTSLSNFLKLQIVNNFINEIKKSLVYYPECDAVYYFKKIIEYFENDLISIYLNIYGIGNEMSTINKCNVSEFNYEEIIKDNRTIIFKNINTTMYLEMFSINPDDFDKVTNTEETRKFIIDYISIDENKNIKYGHSSGEEGYTMDVLEVLVNKAIDALFNPKNSSIIEIY